MSFFHGNSSLNQLPRCYGRLVLVCLLSLGILIPEHNATTQLRKHLGNKTKIETRERKREIEKDKERETERYFRTHRVKKFRDS